MDIQEDKMYRAIHLSSMAYNATYPNPRVGAVLVHGDRVIGEGFHHAYGEPHAEAMCLKNVSEGNRSLIPDSTLYVTLEPCNHHGKQPPCTDLILENKIPRVVIACTDPNPIVHTQGIQKLRDAGVEVEVGVLEDEAASQNQYFLHYHRTGRPYIILKWAEDANGNIGKHGQRVKISSEETDKFTRRWRGEVQSIMVAKNTALEDNPQLTNHSEVGIDPIRIVVDPELAVFENKTLNLSQHPPRTIYLNTQRNDENLSLYKLAEKGNAISAEAITKFLADQHIICCLIEGGANLLQRFLDADCYDEIRVIQSSRETKADIPAPVISDALEVGEEISFDDDRILYYYPTRADVC